MYEIDSENTPQTTICVPALPRTLINSNKIPPVDGFDFGDALESIYPILHTVFSYLTTADLKTVSLVKHSWKEIATEILCKRVAPSSIYKNINYTNITTGLIVISNKAKTLLNEYICVHKLDEKIRITFDEYLSKELLLEGNEYCILVASKLYTFFAKEDEPRKNILTSGLFFPAIPKVRTATFYISRNCIETAKKEYLRENENVKALLIFSVNNLYGISDILDAFLENQIPHEMALGGGIMREVKMIKNSQKRTAQYLCMAFFEDKNEPADFTAQSIVIPEVKSLPETLISVKENMVMRANVVAIRICCSAKKNKYSEVAAFNNVFPGVPLLSFDCDGEIGWNSGNFYEDNQNEEVACKKTKRTLPENVHQYTSILVFLMWGKNV